MMSVREKKILGMSHHLFMKVDAMIATSRQYILIGFSLISSFPCSHVEDTYFPWKKKKKKSFLKIHNLTKHKLG